VDFQCALASHPERSWHEQADRQDADQAQADERSVSARSASGLNKEKRDDGQRQQDPSDTEDGYQSEVELDVRAARYSALKGVTRVNSTVRQSWVTGC
jgi:hypothetical protein